MSLEMWTMMVMALYVFLEHYCWTVAVHSHVREWYSHSFGEDLEKTARKEPSSFLPPVEVVTEPLETEPMITPAAMSEIGEDEFAFLEEVQAFIGAEVEEEDLLTVEDLDDELSPMPVPEVATVKIADERLGLQQWTVVVVGKEQNYVHVYDGTRVWVDMGEDATKVEIGDILELEVLRSQNCITVERYHYLGNQYRISEDYMIPDETPELLLDVV